MPSKRAELVQKYLDSPEAKRRVFAVFSGRRSVGGLEWLSDEDLQRAVDSLVASGELPVKSDTDHGYEPIRRTPMIGGEISQEAIDRLIEQDDELELDDFSDADPGSDDLEELDGDDLVQKFIETSRIRFEGGASALEELASALDPESYRNLDDFFMDNSGAVEEVVNWVAKWADRSPEWKTNLITAIRNRTSAGEDEEW